MPRTLRPPRLLPQASDEEGAPRTLEQINRLGGIIEKISLFYDTLSNKIKKAAGCYDLLPEQSEFRAMIDDNDDLQDLLRAKGVKFNFHRNAIHTGMRVIEQACFSCFHSALTKTPVSRWMPDVLHWFINVWGKEVKDFILEHANQISPEVASELERKIVEICNNKEEPLLGYDDDMCIRLCYRYLEWVPLMRDHPN